jgi:hypothetical protein
MLIEEIESERITKINIVDVPSPDSYRLPSDFDQNLNAPSVVTNKLAYTFGASREVYKRVFSPIQKHNDDPLQPGPGTYEPLKTIGKDGRKYTIKGRIPAPNGKPTLSIQSLYRYCTSSN